MHKLNTTQKATNTKIHQKQHYHGSVTSYHTRPGNEMGLFYNAPEPTRRDSTMTVSTRLDSKHQMTAVAWLSRLEGAI